MRTLTSMLLFLGLLAAIGRASGGIAAGHSLNRMHVEDADDVDELIADDIIRKCIDNGDRAAYNKARHARQRLTQCGTALLHTDRLMPELRTAVISGGKGLVPIVKRVCKSYQSSGRDCLKQYLLELTPCLNASQRALEELVARMAETSWEYACQKDSMRAQQFFKNSTLACLELHSPGVMQCVAPHLARLRAAGDPTRAVAVALANKECNLFIGVSQCIVGELKKCDDSTAANLVRGSFAATLSVSPCANATLDPSPDGGDGEVEVKPRRDSLQTLLDAQSLEMVLINRVQDVIRRLEAARQQAHMERLDRAGALKEAMTQHQAALERLRSLVDAVAPPPPPPPSPPAEEGRQ